MERVRESDDISMPTGRPKDPCKNFIDADRECGRGGGGGGSGAVKTECVMDGHGED